MAASQPANFNVQEFTDAGLLLVGGRLYTYAFGTTTQKIAYTDPAGTISQTYTADGFGGFYIALNARGELPTPLYLAPGSYDLTLKRSDGSTVWTRRAEGVDASLSALGTSSGADLVSYDVLTLSSILKSSLAKVVPSITTLRAVNKLKYNLCLVGGYYAYGDGGGGLYYFDAADTTTADNGGTVIVAADGGRWKLTPPTDGIINVRCFGAKIDGTTSDTAAVQAAINWVVSVGGGQVLIPRGTCRITAPIIWSANSVSLIGEGIGVTTISTNFVAGDIITCGDGSANPNNCIIRDLSITSTVAKSSGAGIRLRNGHNLQIRNVRIDNNMYKGIALDGGAQHFIYFVDNIEINSGIDCCFEMGSDGTQCKDNFISNMVVGGGARGVVIRYASGLYMSKVDAISCTDYGIGLIPAAGQSVASSFFDTVLGDTCGNQGWRITPTSTGFVVDLSLQNCWASSTTTSGGSAAGIYIDGPSANQVSNLNFTTFRAVNNKGSGYIIAQGKFFTFTNCIASGNSQVGSGGAPGFQLIGNINDIQIVGGIYGGYDTLPNFQSYGIQFAGTSNFIQVVGVNTRGNVTGGVNNTSTGINNVIANNV